MKQGFYQDPKTQRLFFLKRAGKVLLIPPWVQTNPHEWRVVRITNDSTEKIDKEGKKTISKNEKANG